MGLTIDAVLGSEDFSKENLIFLLQSQGEERTKLFAKAAETKRKYVGNTVYFRGLIEYSNLCTKNCYYCGIRKDNKNIDRYTLTEKEVLDAVAYAYNEKYASLVIQSGEINSSKFTAEITNLLTKISKATHNSMGITLSLGEQDRETLRQWKDAGGRRYLLRIETSDESLYTKIHPQDTTHSFQKRINTIKLLRETGYQVGTGVMIGLPFQTLEHLANDLLFFRDMDVDMVGMGPYIEHKDTPLYVHKDTLLPQKERFDLTLKMIAILRIMMKDINIVSTTAMQAIDPIGREKALKVGANIIMPNLTPQKYRGSYLLYQDKPCIDEEAEQCKTCLEIRIRFAGDKIGYGEWGDAKHFFRKTSVNN
ncbi:MAG: [FeFe] hydrogenase H-cluster radical SAM maturase HydE [Bacteroidales bacterium]|jgi:biotin synthase|nr:[FeFe] hydrogenase H-cluster radical SAM maturase HydE [Bacteroidales bacterium]